ncbi:hypothetical protein ACFSC6_15340 [Rufibacter sediminis]|uniref:DUF4352 domain-containing protein n=1 Tax=Rufibacter sediminis TaxID=2762756 RepID=A0ABR6VW85_9BACT|nr:hypothetical protein [Rufibacter sediminis]MBC3541409.1 hypothetical protein [Rufibacter sediminis]
MKKNQFILVAVYILTASCVDPNYKQGSTNGTIEENQYSTEEQLGNENQGEPQKQGKPMKVEEFKRFYGSVDPDKLISLEESRTVYDADFNATVKIKVKNNTKESIKAYEVYAEELGFSKKIKAKINGGVTHSASFRITNQETSGSIYFVISKVIFSDGTMVNLSH